ncbi:MAG: NAD-dependent epimerase/dehydratase family protein [Litorimonas sp.]
MLVLYGGTGFIGRHICEIANALNSPSSVISRNPDTAFIQEYAPNLSVYKSGSEGADEAVKAARTVVYLANNSKPATGFQTLSDLVNLDLVTLTNFAENLLKVNPKCHLVYISSGGQIYGKSYHSPIPENEAASPSTPYGLSKRLNESILDYFQQNTDLSISVLRLANPVGRWQVGTRHGLVSAAVKAAVETSALTIFGEGHNARDYFDVDDFARFICESHAKNSFETGTYNIGTGVAVTERDVVQAVSDALGSELKTKYEPGRRFDLPYAVLDITEAREKLGWNPTTPLSESIKKIAQSVKG